MKHSEISKIREEYKKDSDLFIWVAVAANWAALITFFILSW